MNQLTEKHPSISRFDFALGDKVILCECAIRRLYHETLTQGRMTQEEVEKIVKDYIEPLTISKVRLDMINDKTHNFEHHIYYDLAPLPDFREKMCANILIELRKPTYKIYEQEIQGVPVKFTVRCDDKLYGITYNHPIAKLIDKDGKEKKPI